VKIESLDTLVGLLENNADQLTKILDRFSYKVEMGIKIVIKRSSNTVIHWPDYLASLRILCSNAECQLERMRQTPNKILLEGNYLISRGLVNEFWNKIEHVRSVYSLIHVLGSGPWAPYNFCDFALRLPAGRRSGKTEAEQGKEMNVYN
jgi:hypothetical protein